MKIVRYIPAQRLVLELDEADVVEEFGDSDPQHVSESDLRELFDYWLSDTDSEIDDLVWVED